MGQRVQPNHIGSAKGSAGGTSQLFAREVIDHIKRQAKVLRLSDGGQDAGHANAVGNEVGRIFGAHHALAQRAGSKGFDFIEHMRLSRGGGNQLHQLHIARWIEEVNAAKPGFDGFGQSLRKLGDGQA